ncbi:MAG: hypothetical protein JW939_07695 [Candidatus Thermoplasmatota archaeon]|nr:hypothetical protein [Candidatus Thermoplasmatota archaeon]
MQCDLFGQKMILGAASSISDNILWILLVLGAAVFIAGILTIILYWSKYHYRVKLDELEAKHDKLKRYASYQKRRSLREAVTMLTPDERKHLFSIWEDNSIVSRKALFKLNELEDRLRRAERGAEMRWAESQIDDIKETEKMIFPQAFPSQGRGRK